MLFREFLQTRLKQERPHEVRPILEHLTSAYEADGEWEKAYFTCRQLNDSQALASVVERAGPFMFVHAMITLENWLNSLPPSIVRTRPGLVSLRGLLAAEKGNPPEGLSLLNEAEAAYRQKKDSAGLALTLIRRATTRRFLGEYHASLDDTEEALRLTEPHPDLQALFAEGLRLKGVNLYRLGQSRRAIEYFERSLALYINLNSTSNIPILLMDTGIAQLEAGDLQAARASYLKALEIWRAENNLHWQASLFNNLAVLYHQLGEYEPASEAFENGLLCAAKSRNRRVEALILTGLGDLYAEVEGYETAAQAYQKAEAIAGEISETFIQNYLILSQSLLAVRQNQPTKAWQILEEYDHLLQASPSNYERALRHLVQGRIHLLENLPAQAMPALREARACFIEDGRSLETMWSRVWLAGALNHAGQTESARDELREQLALQGGNTHALLVALGQAAPWLEGLGADPEIGRSLTGLLEKAGRLAAKLPAARRALRHLAQSIQLPSAGLSVQAFGRPDVRVNGKSLTMSDWHTQSVRDLFFYFLFMHKPLTREQVGAALWPEIDDARTLHSRFRNEMYRLRRAVGKDVIFFDDEYYRFNRALDYETDVEAFEAHLSRARSAPTAGERIEHYQKAVDLVSGLFLSGVDYDWADQERERLRHTHLSALEELADLYLNHDQLGEAVSTCQRALQVDPYRERMYQLAMRAHAARGDRSAVARSYRACKDALQQLGFSPSEETHALYRQLTSATGPLTDHSQPYKAVIRPAKSARKIN